MEFTPLPRLTPPDDSAAAGQARTVAWPRTVRSFVARGARMTRAQQRAWNELWPTFGVDPGTAPLDLDALFGRHAPRICEIGFGNGEALAALAASCPEADFLGIEVHRPGVGHLMLRCETLALSNLRILCRDAVEVFAQPGTLLIHQPQYVITVPLLPAQVCLAAEKGAAAELKEAHHA